MLDYDFRSKLSHIFGFATLLLYQEYSGGEDNVPAKVQDSHCQVKSWYLLDGNSGHAIFKEKDCDCYLSNHMT